MKRLLSFVLIIVTLLLVLTESTYAIPAFARKYNMSCQTCHSPFPKLKEFGDEFAGNGFVLSDQDAPRYYVKTGDKELDLIRDFPIAARLEAHVTYRSDEPKQGDFKTPYLLKLLSGGALSDDLAYYFYMYFDERGEVAGVEDAYIMFNNLFGSELDVYIGQFQISDPLFKREVRLTLEDYQIYKTKIAQSNFNLAYDRGIMLTYGFESGTDIMIEIINGNGLEDADSKHLFDIDDNKNLFGRVSQNISENLRIGAFGYMGKEEQSHTNYMFENKMNMFGADLTFSYNDVFEFNLQYIQRKDDFDYSGLYYKDQEFETKGAIAEVIITPKGDESKWYGVGIFNWVDSDDLTQNYKTVSSHIGHVLKRNFRIVGELKYDIEHEYMQVGMGFITAF